MTEIFRTSADVCADILKRTSDGDDLAPPHLSLVEAGINGQLNRASLANLGHLHRQVIGGYQPPYFHGLPFLTIDHDGRVFWRDCQVEHYEPAFAFTPHGKHEAAIVAARCRHLESLEIETSTRTVIWNWSAIPDPKPE